MENQHIYKVAFGNQNLKLNLDGIQLPCFILENGQHVFSKDGIQKAMGYLGKSENWLYEFLGHINRLATIDPVLLEKLSRNIVFELNDENKAIIKHGVEPQLLIDACQAIIKANTDGFLYLSEQKFARAADVIIKKTDGRSLNGMIDNASGYELFKQSHKDALSRFMVKNFGGNHFIWVKTFPDVFFERIFLEKDWNWADLVQKDAEIAAYLDDIIFTRLEASLLEELAATKPRMTYRKAYVAEKYLENTDLKAHLHLIMTLYDASGKSPAIFEQFLNKTCPKKSQNAKIHKVPAEKKSGSQNLEGFNENLKKVLGRTAK